MTFEGGDKWGVYQRTVNIFKRRVEKFEIIIFMYYNIKSNTFPLLLIPKVNKSD